MQQGYLLDTNAYFNILRLAKPQVDSMNTFAEQMKTLNSGSVYISAITRIEIISVLGKYSRGVTGGFQKCNCQISADGQRCQNKKYTVPRKKWNMRTVKAWTRLIKETLEGHSSLINVEILPFNDDIISEAQQIILCALINNFGSMDAMIAATAKKAIDEQRNITVVTSDKGLKACLNRCSISCWDLFQSK